jgi:kinesin family protein 6/9
MPSVKVSVRVKPEAGENTLDPFKLDAATGSISLTVAGHAHDFVFDEVFAQDASQEEVFNKSAVEICKDVLDGFNGTIFAYGQTGAGKTHTMTGPSEIDNYEKDCGLCMRTAAYLFEKSRKMTDAVSMRISILEIYNETLIDLLQPMPAANNTAAMSAAAAAPKLNVIEKPTGVSVPALRVMPMAHEEDAFAFMLDAHHNRVVAEHQLNRASSRSHVLYTFYITIVKQQDPDAGARTKNVRKSGSNEEPEPEVVTSKLHLVDLAGSERSKKSGSDGSTLKEANYINRSLSYLEQVVVALTQAKREHIPYRQSKLTHLLKDSLGGNCHTALISCVWPHRQHGWETLSTLRFATRMKNIENTPVRNSLIKQGEAGSGVNAQLQKQVNMLKKELIMRDTITGNDPFLTELTLNQKAASMKQCCEIVGSHIPSTNTPATMFALLPPELAAAGQRTDMQALSESYYQSKMLHVESLSQVHFLLGCMRAAVWEACENDPTVVANVLDRTMDAFREVYDTDSPADPSSALPAFANLEQRSELDVVHRRSQQKLQQQQEGEGGGGEREAWIYPSGTQPGDDGSEGGNDQQQHQQQQPSPLRQSRSLGSLQGSGSKAAGGRGSNVYNEDDDVSGTLADLRQAGANDFPEAQPDPFNERGEQEMRYASSVPKLPYLPNAMGSNSSNESGDGNALPDLHDPLYVPAEQTMSFEEFKSGPGSALHSAYNDLREHLRTEKGRMREIAGLANRKKAEIDQFSVYIAEIDQQSQQVAAGAEQLEGSLNDGALGAAGQVESVVQEAERKFAEERNSLVMRMEQTKASYRAVHVEFQLCKKQIEETQMLKKRAMNDIVSAYDRLATHRPQPT